MARSLGCLIRQKRGTGEYLLQPPNGGKSLRINGRKKDAPRSLICLLRRMGS